MRVLTSLATHENHRLAQLLRVAHWAQALRTPCRRPTGIVWQLLQVQFVRRSRPRRTSFFALTHTSLQLDAAATPHFSPMTANHRACALAACAVVPVAAVAGNDEPPISIYGIVDVAISSQDSGAPGMRRQTVLTSGLWSTSRIGLKGNEALGGGLEALFNLEAGVDVTGNEPNPDFFNRRSVAGLKGDFGKVMLGRDYTPLSDIASETDPLGQSFYGSTLVAFGSGRLTRRVSNAVTYTTPPLGGFAAVGTAAAGEGQGPRTWSVGTSYAGEPLYVGAAYLDLKGQGVDVRQYVIGARLQFGGLTVASNYLRADYEGPMSGSVPRFSQWNIGANQRSGPHQVFANLQTNRLDGDGARGTTLSLAYAYFLSQRTQLYATAAVLRNNDRAVFGLGSASSPPDEARGADPSAIALGIQHKF